MSASFVLADEAVYFYCLECRRQPSLQSNGAWNIIAMHETPLLTEISAA